MLNAIFSGAFSIVLLLASFWMGSIMMRRKFRARVDEMKDRDRGAFDNVMIGRDFLDYVGPHEMFKYSIFKLGRRASK